MGNVKKIVINRCYGGFGVSKKAVEYMAERGDEQARKDVLRKEKITWAGDETFYDYERDNLLLVEAVETLGVEASGCHAKLKVVEIPIDVDWRIDDYDGMERVVEVHRAWE